MRLLLAVSQNANALERLRPLRPAVGFGAAALCIVALAGCASQPTRYASGGSGRHYDPRLGVYTSDRLIADGEPIPRGGGTYLVGRPYTIAGRAYYPNQRPEGYTAVGMASWYGDAFHGRRTANGEIFDKNSISAAHPTLPLPSYVRVTNTGNGRSIIVRVNDRGPYHGGRVMDVSQRVAEALSFKGQGTAQVRIEYVGRASLGGSDDGRLLATLRVDGVPAQIDGASQEPTMLADAEPGAPAPPAPSPQPQRVARAAEQDIQPFDGAQTLPPPRRFPAPVPPQRPFDFETTRRAGMLPPARIAPEARNRSDRPLQERIGGGPREPLVTFAADDPGPPAEAPRLPPRRRMPPTRAGDAADFNAQ